LLPSYGLVVSKLTHKKFDLKSFADRRDPGEGAAFAGSGWQSASAASLTRPNK